MSTIYDANYGNFTTPLLKKVREEIYGLDIGQNSWSTAVEYDLFFSWLGLTAASTVLDLGCGAGGPSLYLGRTVGCSVLGLDIEPKGIETANELSRSQGLYPRVRFELEDISEGIERGDRAYDAIICVDAVIHFAKRLQALSRCRELLRPGGKLLFTDAAIVAGLISSREIAFRSSAGHCVFSPEGEDEKLIEMAKLKLVTQHDLTESCERISALRVTVRQKYKRELVALEGPTLFARTQRYLQTVRDLSQERRLLRFAFLCERPGGR
jgi:SAM-dependent methyltransferase